MKSKILGHREHDVGVEVIDEQGHVHTVEVRWDGEVEHYADAYPHKREERTQEQQILMTQVEARAKYVAQQEFPEEDILDPMWDPAFLDRAVEALVNYEQSAFESEFRDFYDALRNPQQFAPEARRPTISKAFAVDSNNRIAHVGEVVIRYTDDHGDIEQYGTFPDQNTYELAVCILPPLDFEPGFTFEEDFPPMVVNHLMAHIRDIYRHMGEEPPEEYQVNGIGKLDFAGGGLEDHM